MRRPIWPDGQARVRAEDLHVEVRVRHVLPDDVVRVRGPEDAVRRREGDLARGREARRDGDHVRLRDAELEQTIREHLAEFDRLDGFRRVRPDHDHAGIAASEVDHGLREVRALALLLPLGDERGKARASPATHASRRSAIGTLRGLPPLS